MGGSRYALLKPTVLVAAVILSTSCTRHKPSVQASSIEFTKLPPMGEGSPEKLLAIEGRVKGAAPEDQIVLYARSGPWWVQPTAAEPFTAIQPDSTWRSTTHPGNAYAALLVKPGFRPPPTINGLPQKGGRIVAVAVAEGPMLPHADTNILQFSGYPWDVRSTASDRGGTRNHYDPANAWVDRNGFLHLEIARRENQWTSAEVSLSHSLGYGSYRFVVSDVSHLEPAAVFSIFTWDESGPPREMDIEISRWGESASKNAQYVIQPYYVPANAFRFVAPKGKLSYSFRWEPGRVSFKTTRSASSSGLVSEHVFTSGVPIPGEETIHMNLYVFDNKAHPLRNGTEVIIESFEYLP